MAVAEYTTDTAAGELRLLPIGQIIPAADNPRQTLTDLDGLAASIRAVGLLTPVLVEDSGDGTYRLVAGHRRHAAAQIAGLAELPALVRSFDPLSRQCARLVENGQRVNLTPMEEAAAYQDLLSLDVDADALASSVGRPRAEVDGRLAVFALPRSVHQLLADDALTYAEALLLTQVAEYPEDIDDALARCEKWGWTVGQAVEHVRTHRARTIKAEATRQKLTRQKVAIIDTPEHGFLTGNHTAKPLGDSWGGVPITRAAHKKEPCHAAYIGHDGGPVYVCTEPKRHDPERPDGGAPAVNAKAERAAKRAANKARRQASADRTAAAGALLTGEGELDVLGYLLGAVLGHAPREILPAAARLLGLDVPAGQQWAASEPAAAALRVHAGTDAEAALRVAVAIHWALAEKDAGAEHPSFRGGPGVIAYTDLLATRGYTETAGDAANRDRYRVRGAADLMADEDDEPLTATQAETDSPDDATE
jgi:ParB/RepB/Spo0J family partition protein